MKVGILGGTFDPPHLGHLKMAETALKELALDKVIFMLSAKPPLKEGTRAITSSEQRLAMLNIFIKDYPEFDISDVEIRRAAKGEKSYTIDTLIELKKPYPEAEIYWLIGEDSLQEIVDGKWKNAELIFKLAKVVVFSRPGFKVEKVPEWVKFQRIKIDILISSTEIRERLKKGLAVDKLLPKKVLDYIIKNRLYKI